MGNEPGPDVGSVEGDSVKSIPAIPWSIVVVALAVLASLVFLVYVGKMPPELLSALVAALTGGGIGHVVTKNQMSK